MRKWRAVGLDQTPVITRAFYGSAAVLALLIGAQAATKAGGCVADSVCGLGAALAPNAAMGALLAALVGVGWLVQRLVRRKQRTTAPE